jgi:hypothetical protein
MPSCKGKSTPAANLGRGPSRTIPWPAWPPAPPGIGFGHIGMQQDIAPRFIAAIDTDREASPSIGSSKRFVRDCCAPYRDQRASVLLLINGCELARRRDG